MRATTGWAATVGALAMACSMTPMRESAAQNATEQLSNIPGVRGSAMELDTTENEIVQAFVAGTHAGGYTVTKYSVYVRGTSLAGKTLITRLYTTDANGEPDAPLSDEVTVDITSSVGQAVEFTLDTPVEMHAKTIYALAVKMRPTAPGENSYDTYDGSPWSIFVRAVSGDDDDQRLNYTDFGNNPWVFVPGAMTRTKASAAYTRESVTMGMSVHGYGNENSNPVAHDNEIKLKAGETRRLTRSDFKWSDPDPGAQVLWVDVRAENLAPLELWSRGKRLQGGRTQGLGDANFNRKEVYVRAGDSVAAGASGTIRFRVWDGEGNDGEGLGRSNWATLRVTTIAEHAQAPAIRTTRTHQGIEVRWDAAQAENPITHYEYRGRQMFRPEWTDVAWITAQDGDDSGDSVVDERSGFVATTENYYGWEVQVRAVTEFGPGAIGTVRVGSQQESSSRENTLLSNARTPYRVDLGRRRGPEDPSLDQPFRTGANSDGYHLDKIELNGAGRRPTAAGRVTAKLCKVSGNTCETLTRRGTDAYSLNFEPAAGTKLEASTDYEVRVSAPGEMRASGAGRWDLYQADNETLPGWSIGKVSEFNAALRLTLRGTPAGPDDVCLRNAGIAAAIVAAVAEASACGEVTKEHLGAIKRLQRVPGIPVNGIVNGQELDGMTNLEHLDLSGSGVTGFATNTLDRMKKLKTFNASSNALTGLPATLFSKNEVIETIRIADNPNLGVPPGRLLAGKTTLKEYDAENTGMADIPPAFFGATTTLETLKIGANGLTAHDLVGQIERLTTLTTLSMHGNNLSGLRAAVLSGRTLSAATRG